MTNILNPYIAGAPVVETSMFFGREDIFGWIERSLTGKFVNHILVLHGQRRVGKTSVLKQIPRHLPKHYIQVFFDLQGRTNTTMDRFLWWMASEISRTLIKECNLDLSKIERNAFADPEAFINDFLPSLREQLQEKILLLTFDEFDTLDRPDIQDSLARPLVAYLRRLMEIEGLNFIFSIGSSGNKLENMQASYTDFFKSALYRKVSFLTKDDCVRLITKPVEGTIIYEPAAVEKISHFTSGHPYFTQLMCHELFSRCQKTGERTITAQDVDAILEDVIERGTVNLKFVWDEASDLEKWILAAVAQEECAPLKRIHQILKGHGLRTNDADLNSAILHLRDKDVLDADNRFVIQLLKLWLLTNRPMDRVREELVQTNPIADRYIEIGDEYRERGENQQAIQSFEQALQVQPNNAHALSNIAAIQISQNENSEAAETFKKILAIDDENILARQGYSQTQLVIAQIALSEDREDDAEKAFKAILHFIPTNPEANKQLAALYVKQAEELLKNNQENKGYEKFNQAISLNPEDQSIKQRYDKVVADKRAAQVQEWLEKAEKSLARQRWDEAASMVDEAINIDPENSELQKRLLEIKDAPRQEKIKSYKQEAEQAIAKGNYPKAISAIQTAIQLAPEDSSLRQWIDSIQSDQANAQLRLYQSQADQAEKAGNWEAAIAAREAALKLDSQNERLTNALQKTRDAKQKQKINSLRLKIDQAKKEQNWEAALAAGEEYLQFSPGDQEVKNNLENFKIEQRKSRLVSLKTQAQSASKAEKWEDAIQHWQAYLAEQPEDGARVEKLIDQAKQKAALLKDYETAQAHIRKRQYNRAIHLLQGIIAKDPTYKASSRLLVEAVEANKQKKPIWKTPWIYVGGGVLILAVLVVLMLPQIRVWINSSGEPVGIAEVISTPTTSALPTPLGKTIYVSNANDSGLASFRYALMIAEEYDKIIFNPNIFPPEDPMRIFLNSELPRITKGHITLDASNAGVILDGSNIEDDKIFGLIISSDYNKVMGLQIVNFTNTIAVYVEGGSYNQIGGDRNQGVGPVGQGNLISNNGVGIQLLSTGGGNIITGNLIGTGLNGFTPMGNRGSSIVIENNQTFFPVPNTIGPDNIIAHNGSGDLDTGIVINSGEIPTVITQNSIHDNYGKGIYYPENDAEVEPPAIIYHDLEEGVASGQVCSGCEVEIFSTYQNEGDKFEGSVRADDFGNFVFYKEESFSGPNLTAIAISSENKTSEFSDPPSPNSAMKAALAMMEGEPTYQTSFDVWEFGDPGENVVIENGKLILPSEGSNVGQGLSDKISDKLAVQFEFQIPQSSFEGTCFFGMSNEEENRFFGIGFRSNGTSFAEQYVLPDQNSQLAEGTYEYYANQPNVGLVIVMGDQISVFVNDQLVYSFFGPQGSAVYNLQHVNAEWGATCEFDNYKIWNLEGLEFEPPLPPESFTQKIFYEPLQEIMQSEPTYQTSFDVWEFGDPGENVVMENGKLIMPSENNNIGQLLSQENSNKFAVKFEFQILDSGLDGACKFSMENDEINNNIGFGFKANGTSYTERNVQDNNLHLAEGLYNYIDDQPNEVLIIVIEDQISVFANDQLLYSFFDQEGSLVYNQQSLVADAYNICEFDNYKIWNLEGVEFGQVEIENQGSQTINDPTWVQDFVNPVLDYIEDRSPDFEDDFEKSSVVWVMHSVSRHQKSVVDGEMILIGAVQNTMITYHDYMIDVNIRHINGYHAGLEFTNGGNVYCKVLVGFWGESAHISCSDPTDFQLTRGSSAIVNLRLIVKGSKITVIVNKQPVVNIEDDKFRLYRGEKPNVSLTTNDNDSTIAFSNFKAWNLTQLEIP
ncbi:MAG: tetratricopeptide repeat protein [Anaerolineaceae bacterium]|nr:tetratricopeptide repeat protein [Anaerolineaceae bacterium]